MTTEEIIEEVLTPEEIRAIGYRQTRRNRIAMWAAIFSAAALVVSTIAAIYTVDRANGAEKVSTRNDCRSEYESLFEQRRDDLFTSSAKTEAMLGAGILNNLAGIPPDMDDVEAYAEQRRGVDNAADAVDVLPRTSEAVEHGFTLDGKKYPPCPEVG